MNCSDLFLFVLHLMVKYCAALCILIQYWKFSLQVLSFSTFSLCFKSFYYLCSSWIRVGQTDALTTANSTTPWFSWVQKLVNYFWYYTSVPHLYDATHKLWLKYIKIEKNERIITLKICMCFFPGCTKKAKNQCSRFRSAV